MKNTCTLELRDMKLYLNGQELPNVTNAELICEGAAQPYIKLSMTIPLERKELVLQATVYKP